MTVCIAGMHRSGTSMVTRLLHMCGLYLGDEQDLIRITPDNPEGHFENARFVRINELILKGLNGTWYSPPPLHSGWVTSEPVAQLRTAAQSLISSYTEHEPWGWKDPRNSLLLPFWMNLLPGLKVVVCLRNPIEVAESLRRRYFFEYSSGGTLLRLYRRTKATISINQRRAFTVGSCLELWKAYNQRLLRDTLPEQRIITHYDAYFRDAATELRRVLGFLNMTPSNDVISSSSTFSSAHLRHHRVPANELDRLPPDVLHLYTQMMQEANSA